MPGSQLRKILDERPEDRSAADYFAVHSPACECETAPPVAGGHGAVNGDEILTMLLGNPRQRREAYKDEKKRKREGFPYRAQLFDAAYEGGLSTLRENKATDREVKIQAEEVASGLRREKPEGGLYGVLQFGARQIFETTEEDGSRAFCVYDTPIDVGNPESEVLSHSDVFAAGPAKVRERRTQLRLIIHAAVKSSFKVLDLDEYRNGLLIPFSETDRDS